LHGAPEQLCLKVLAIWHHKSVNCRLNEISREWDSTRNALVKASLPPRQLLTQRCRITQQPTHSPRSSPHYNWLVERHHALERKLELISQTAQTVLEFMQHSSSQRVEWYVVILIVVEILLSLYDIFFKS